MQQMGPEAGPKQKAPAGVCEFRDTMAESDFSFLDAITAPPPRRLPEVLEMAGSQVRRLHKEWRRLYDEITLPKGDVAEQAFRNWRGGDFLGWLRSKTDMGRINQLFRMIEEKIAELQQNLVPDEQKDKKIELSWKGKQINAELVEDVRELKALLRQVQEVL